MQSRLQTGTNVAPGVWRRPSLLIVGAALLMLCGLIAYLLKGQWHGALPEGPDVGDSMEANGSPGTGLSEVELRTTPPRRVKPAQPQKNPIDLRRTATANGTHFQLPDGSYAPCLNGILHAPAMQWPSDVPWSPIRRKIVDREGKEWYEHVDGSYSTTELMYRSDLKRSEPVVQVRNPVPVVPMEGASEGLGPRAK